MSERDEVIRGLIEMARFLIDHPDLEFPADLSTSSKWGHDTTERTAIRRIEEWKAAGFVDSHEGYQAPGHYGVDLKFGAFELRFSHVEEAAMRPVAWGARGEADSAFQSRVNEALAATEAKPEQCPSSAFTTSDGYQHDYHTCHLPHAHDGVHVCECGYEWYGFQAASTTGQPS